MAAYLREDGDGDGDKKRDQTAGGLSRATVGKEGGEGRHIEHRRSKDITRRRSMEQEE